uniref:Col_cuticle_N domain-containing protein n=1 Tax=Rhabditophanes sp. KR3021 TaxID=114890 RepID=A0AC35TN29_9BILA
MGVRTIATIVCAIVLLALSSITFYNLGYTEGRIVEKRTLNNCIPVINRIFDGGEKIKKIVTTKKETNESSKNPTSGSSENSTSVASKNTSRGATVSFNKLASAEPTASTEKPS